MLIKWFGHASFEIATNAGTIITDPFNGELGYPMFPRQADVVTVSHQHWDHNAVETVSGSPQVFCEPGPFKVFPPFMMQNPDRKEAVIQFLKSVRKT
jgi:L-ascorbate metabolism protein UlaG (beta-lactamase superfamily)